MNPNSSQQSSAKPMKQPDIHSTYITGFGSGFFGLNEQEAPQNSLTDMNNAKIYIDKTIRPRMRLKGFLREQIKSRASHCLLSIMTFFI